MRNTFINTISDACKTREDVFFISGDAGLGVFDEFKVSYPDRFPEEYIFELTKEELEDLRWKFSTTKFAMTRVLPKAFTERGLYMLATILKSEKATETTIAIIETFYKLRTLQKTVKELTTKQDKEEQKSLMQKSGELMTEILDDALESDESETTIELNFAVLKFKHTMKKKQNKNKGNAN